jgi:hypothetical protein
MCQRIVECGVLTGTRCAEGIMASGHVNRTNRFHEGCARWLDCWPSQIGGSFDVADSRRSNTCRRGL